jgi:hypothetical protein
MRAGCAISTPRRCTGPGFPSIASARACAASTGAGSCCPPRSVGLLDPVGGGAAAGASSGHYPFEIRYDYSYDGTMRSLEHSLQRLGTNAIDIVLIHDVNKRWQGEMLEQRYAEAMGGAHRALVELRAAGAIKAFGVGVNDWSILMRFAADGDFDCFMLAAATRCSTTARSTRSCPTASAAASRC